MAYCYNDNAPYDGPLIDIRRLDATKQYLKHYDNFLMLDFLAKNETDRNERAQAEKELAICRRKLRFWQRQDNFNAERAREAALEKKRMWK